MDNYRAKQKGPETTEHHATYCKSQERQKIKETEAMLRFDTDHYRLYGVCPSFAFDDGRV